jgi:hypothetical protein
MHTSHFKPFVLSLSWHEWLDFVMFLIRTHFDELSANKLNHPRQSRGLIIVSPSKGHIHEPPKGDHSSKN